MQIRSAKNLTSENCIALVVYVLLDKEQEKYLSTFEVIHPEEDIDMDQYDALLEGIAFAQYKMETLVEELDAELDDEDEEDE